MGKFAADGLRTAIHGDSPPAETARLKSGKYLVLLGILCAAAAGGCPSTNMAFAFGGKQFGSPENVVSNHLSVTQVVNSMCEVLPYVFALIRATSMPWNHTKQVWNISLAGEW